MELVCGVGERSVFARVASLSAAGVLGRAAGRKARVADCVAWRGPPAVIEPAGRGRYGRSAGGPGFRPIVEGLLMAIGRAIPIIVWEPVIGLATPFAFVHGAKLYFIHARLREVVEPPQGPTLLGVVNRIEAVHGLAGGQYM